MAQAPAENCAAVVLCGGMSRRMGISKAMLPFGDETMLGRVVRLLGEVLQPVVVVAEPGDSVGVLAQSVRLCHDRAQGRGPLEGIAVGLSAVRATADRAFIAGCDTPFLRATFVRRMIELAGAHDAAAACIDGEPRPLPGVYSTRLLDEAERRLADGSMSLRSLLQGVDTRWIRIEELKTADPKLEGLMNVNRAADYLAALATAGFEAPADVRARLLGMQ